MITGSILSPTIGAVGIAPSTTRFVSLTGVSISAGADFDIFISESRGYLCELLIRSQSPDLSLRLYCDGGLSIYNSFSDLVCIGQSSPDISAFDELDMNGNTTGYYVVSVRNIPYYESCSAIVENNGITTLLLPHIFVKYIIYVS